MLFYFLLSFQRLIVTQLDNQEKNKTFDQCKQNIKEAFFNLNKITLTDEHYFYLIRKYDFYEYRMRNKFVCLVCISKNKYKVNSFKSQELPVKEEDVVEIYSLYVNKEYRRKGYARKLLYSALREFKSHYNLKDDFIIALHIDPNYEYMSISFAFYYSIGFDKGSFCRNAPHDFKENFNYELLHDPIEIIKDPSLCKKKGGFMALYGRYNKFNPFASIKSEKLFEFGENLRVILKNRRSGFY